MKRWIADPDGDAWLYCIEEVGSPLYCKIGVATNLSKRLSSLQGGNPRKLQYVWVIKTSRFDALGNEFSMLSRVRQASDSVRLMSEWISATPELMFDRAKEFYEKLEAA